VPRLPVAVTFRNGENEPAGWQPFKQPPRHGILDGLAEATQEIGPIRPGLGALFDSDTVFAKTREAAAMVLCWFLAKTRKLPARFQLAGITSSRSRNCRKSAEGEGIAGEVREGSLKYRQASSATAVFGRATDMLAA
jgi:hypothetical protein